MKTEFENLIKNYNLEKTKEFYSRLQNISKNTLEVVLNFSGNVMEIKTVNKKNENSSSLIITYFQENFKYQINSNKILNGNVLSSDLTVNIILKLLNQNPKDFEIIHTDYIEFIRNNTNLLKNSIIRKVRYINCENKEWLIDRRPIYKNRFLLSYETVAETIVSRRSGKDDRHEDSTQTKYSILNLNDTNQLDEGIWENIQKATEMLNEYQSSTSYYYGGTSSYYSTGKKKDLKKSNYLNLLLDNYELNEYSTLEELNNIFYAVKIYNPQNEFDNYYQKYASEWFINITVSKLLIFLIFKKDSFSDLKVFNRFFWSLFFDYFFLNANNSIFLNVFDQVYRDNKVKVDSYINGFYNDELFEKKIIELLISIKYDNKPISAYLLIHSFLNLFQDEFDS